MNWKAAKEEEASQDAGGEGAIVAEGMTTAKEPEAEDFSTKSMCHLQKTRTLALCLGTWALVHLDALRAF